VVATAVTGLLVASSIVLIAGPAQAAAAGDFTASNGISYAYDTDASGDTVTAVGYTGAGASIEVPATIDNGVPAVSYAVFAIGAGAFSGAGLASLTLNDGLTDIGDYAFRNNRLGAVEIPASVSTIGISAFAGSDVTSLTLNDGLTTIGDYAFRNNRLGAVEIPATVTTIGNSAFSETGLTSLTLHDGLTAIGNYAFQHNSLGAVNIPATVTTIGSRAFSETGVTSLTLHDGLTDIGDYAFQNNRLVTVDMPASVTTIGARAFNGNPIATVTFAGSAPSIVGVRESEAPLGAEATVHFRSEFGVDAGMTNGFTVPLWKGYETVIDPVVSFNTDGHGSVDAQLLTAGEAPVVPATPVVSGWTFDGWFTSEDFTTPFDFTDAPLDNVTAFAKWTAVDPIVSFNTGGHGTVDAQQLTAGDAPVEPATPVVSGWKLDGWFTSEDFTTPFDFTAVPLEDVTVFAKWSAVDPALALDLGLAVGDAVAGAPVTVSGSGLQEGSDYTGILRSTPVLLVGGTIGAAGDFTNSAVMPTGLSAGQHTVTLTGTAANGSPVTSVVYLTVSATGTVLYISDTRAQTAEEAAASLATASAATAATAALAAQSLATTGFEGAPLGLAALLLLIAGATLVARRRHVAA